MYEMYPEAWIQSREESSERPRRRPRKAHSVLPAVITLHIEALRAAPQH
jgi:hypothetical protein